MKTKFLVAALVSLGVSLPAWSADTASLRANLVDAKTMDALFAQSTKETQLARRGGRSVRGGRSYSRPRHGSSRSSNSWVAPAVGGAIIGAIIANQASSASRSSSHEAAKRRCAEKYRSYDWRSETYVTYDGRVRSCP